MLNFFDDLKKAVMNEDFMETDFVIEKIKAEKNPFEYIEPMLRLMEENPEIDFGVPGPMVHFMETYYKKGYESLLLESVKRKPTSQTVWMINRIMNDPGLSDKEVYLDTLKTSLQRNDLDNVVVDEIRGYLKFQAER